MATPLLGDVGLGSGLVGLLGLRYS